MRRSAVLFVAAVATAILVGACGPPRVEVGELQTETRSVEPENAESVRADLRMAIGELNLTGGADGLMEADFAYNVPDWQPQVNYEVVGDTGELNVEQQGLVKGSPRRIAATGWTGGLNAPDP